MKRIVPYLVFLSLLLVAGCEEVITIDLEGNEPKIVVEGSIENDGVPVVILSRSFPFFGDVDINDIGTLLLKGAQVTVRAGSDSVVLTEYDRDVLASLDSAEFAAIAPALQQFTGLPISPGVINFLPDITFYTVSPADIGFTGEFGRRYDLEIVFSGHELFGDRRLTATTYIPQPVALDSLWVRDHPNDDIDTLFELRGRLPEPDTLGNYYRIFTRENGWLWLTTGNSVFDDAFINGQSWPFTIFRGISERKNWKTAILKSKPTGGRASPPK